MTAFILLVLSAAWVCPSCGGGVDEAFCPRCLIPEPPSGMAFVPGDTITVDGVPCTVPSFYVDSAAVSYEDILPWLNGAFEDGEGLAALVTGQYDADFQFLRYTPFTGDASGSGLAVPPACMGLPAASVTLEGARSYLASEGRRLPSAAELALAARNGLVAEVDVFSVMSTYADMMEQSMGSMLGRLSTQAMFAGYSTASERVMWEWTGSLPGSPADVARDADAPCATLYRPGGTGVADAGSGYFNVAFRGVVPLPLAASR